MARLFDDGSSEYLEIDQAVDDGQTLTLAAWMYTNDTSNAGCVLGLFDKDVAGANRIAIISNEAGNDPLYAGAFLQDTSSVFLRSKVLAIQIIANTWYHLAGTFSIGGPTAVIGYVNGTAGVAATTSYGITNLDRTSIGRFGDSTPSLYWSGGIGEAAVWNLVLTPAEIMVLATGIRPIMVRPQSIVAYWPLVRDQDYDLVNGYAMTAYNTPGIAAHPPVIYGATPGLFGEGAGAGPTNLYPGLSGLSGLTGLMPIMGVA